MAEAVIVGRDAVAQRVIEGLQNLYNTQLKPVEDASFFSKFQRETMSPSELAAKTHVLVIGPYSTGKTTFIRYLLKQDFKSMNIGPEPTTDMFTVLMHAEDDRTIPGNTLSLIASLPYKGLQQFGSSFLKRLIASLSPSKFLEHITLIDSPGALTGEQADMRRSYSFPLVSRWFGDRSDLIILIFDAHKLDISDELRAVMERLIDHQEKIRIILNKSDQIDHAQLMRVYGSLMWSIGNIFPNPEVVRVYVGSFWDKPLKYKTHEKLFRRDHESLLDELYSLPKQCTVRKIDQITSRVKRLKAHLCILGYLKSQLPYFGRDSMNEVFANDLYQIFDKVISMHNLHAADMPHVEEFKEALASFNMSELPALKNETLQSLDYVLSMHIPKILYEAGGEEHVFKYTAQIEAPPDEITNARKMLASKTSSNFVSRLIHKGSSNRFGKKSPEAANAVAKGAVSVESTGPLSRFSTRVLLFAIMLVFVSILCGSFFFRRALAAPHEQ